MKKLVGIMLLFLAMILFSSCNSIDEEHKRAELPYPSDYRGENAIESSAQEESSEQFLEDIINIGLTEDIFMAFFAWPVFSPAESPIELDVESMGMVMETIQALELRELLEQDPEFNADLYNLVTVRDSIGMDRLDNYIFVYPYDFRNDPCYSSNKMSHEELETLMTPKCIIVHDYNMERQSDYTYVFFEGKYYLTNEKSSQMLINMFNTLLDKFGW